MLQCRSDACFTKDRKLLFSNNYKGHIVEWGGYCTYIGEKEIKFEMIPDINLTLNYDSTYECLFPKIFVTGSFCNFKAKIIDFGASISDHKFKAVSEISTVDLDINWEEYVFLFGMKGRFYPQLLFKEFWKGSQFLSFFLTTCEFLFLGHDIILRGRCENVVNVVNDGVSNDVEIGFTLHESFVVPRTELINLIIPKDKLVSMKSNCNDFFTVKVKCVTRQMYVKPHTFKFVELIEFPTVEEEV
jgi:hypothetical protein